MSTVFTLESLVEELEREYAPFRLEVGGQEFVLRSLLRIGKGDREAVMERLKSLESAKDEQDEQDAGVDEDELLNAVKFVLVTVTADGKGARLTKAVGDDLLLNMKILEKWTAATQPGEAEDSPS